MAVFPELIPSTRTYSPGAFPHTAHRVYDGSEARVRHSNTVLGVRLRLFFPALATADLLLVIAHYNGQRGRFLPFAIPVELLSGTTTPADFTPAGHQWRYAAKPTAEDISVNGTTPSNLHNLTVELETVPPENTIVKGARLRVRASLRAGSAQLGEFLEVFTSLDAGAALASLALSATATLEAGSPFPVVSLDVVATLAAGEFILPAEGELFVTATLTAGAASAFDMLALSPSAWWDLSDASTVTTSSGEITALNDKSGGGRTLEPQAGFGRPAYATAAMNGLNVAQWISSDNGTPLRNLSSATFTLQEVYVVLSYSGGTQFTNYDGILGSGNDADFWISGNNTGTSLQSGGPFNNAFINGSGTNSFSDVFPEIESPCLLRITASSPVATTAGVRFGVDRIYADLSRSWSGNIAELVTFPATLSAGNRADLETHLMVKWGI